jgi:endonuclease-8
MPEGPEIHRAAEKIRSAREGKIIEDVEITLPRYAANTDQILGNTVLKVEARGKAMLIHFDSFVLYSHNQLYGRWTVNLRKTAPKKWNRSLRIALSTDSHTCRLWSATDILMLEPWELSGHQYIAKLGPDVVLQSTTSEHLIAHMNQKRFQRKHLKTLLLDQGFFAGIGNYLRSEVLFAAQLHPDRTVSSLDDEEKLRLAEQALFLSQQSLKVPGITIDLELYDQLRDIGLSRGQARHWVFTRNDSPCHQCGDLIVHSRPGGRRLDFCPRCQS